MTEFIDELTEILRNDISDITADSLDSINNNISTKLGDGISFDEGNKITDIKIGVENGKPTIKFNNDGDAVPLDEFKKNLYGEGPTVETEGVEPNYEASFKAMFGDDVDVKSDSFKKLQQNASDEWRTTNEPTRNLTGENARATDATRSREEKLGDDIKNAKDNKEEVKRLMEDWMKENFGDSLDKETIRNFFEST
jgi:hypothetical protein